jgi:streptogramin lyase
MNHPQSVCVDASGNIYIADTCNHVIRKVDSVTGIITTVAGNNNLGGTYQGDGGDPLNAGLSFPNAVSVDSAGNIYIADTYNNVIRKVTYNH